MVAITELKDTNWLVTENISDRHVFVKIENEIVIEQFPGGTWRLAKIIALNDLTTSLKINNYVIFYSVEKRQPNECWLPTSMLLPLLTTLNLSDIKTLILATLAQMILLESGQTFGSRCVILSSGEFDVALNHQAKLMGYSVCDTSEQNIDVIIVCKQTLTDSDYNIMRNCREYATLMLLKDTQFESARLSNNLQSNIQMFCPEKIFGESSWLIKSISYMKIDFEQAFVANQNITQMQTTNDSISMNLTSDVNISTIGNTEDFNRLLSVVIHEKPSIKYAGYLSALNEKNLNRVKAIDTASFAHFDDLLASDTNMIIIDTLEGDILGRLIQLLQHKKHILFHRVPSFDSSEWQEILSCAAEHSVMVLPMVSHICSRFVISICTGLSDRIEPLNIIFKLSVEHSEFLYWVFFCQTVVGAELLDLNISADGHVVTCRYSDQSTAVIWFIGQSDNNTTFMVSCQENSWKITDWQVFESRKSEQHITKKSANFQRGDTQFMSDIIGNLQNGELQKLNQNWVSILNNKNVIEILDGELL